MANYLVTGGCGFIGTHLVARLLDQGHSVRVLDDLSTGNITPLHSCCETITGDVVDANTVNRCMQDMDGCFHLAAVTSNEHREYNWRNDHQVNLGGAINVFAAARLRRTPVVYASSANVYGDSADSPLKESSATRPLSGYGADKLGCELHARVATMRDHVPTTGMRLFNVYGPQQNPASTYSNVISVFAAHLLRGEALPVYGDGEQVRDFICVDDTVRFLLAAMERCGAHAAVYNVCTGRPTTVIQLARTLMAISGTDVPIRYCGPRRGDLHASVGDPTHLHRSLQMRALQPFGQGLRALLDSLRHEVGRDFKVQA